MKPVLHQIEFNGALLARGFWLYIWEITTRAGRKVHYVGRTGDKASGVCQSPFDRLSKHLGSNPNNNALQRHLKNQKLRQEDCSFRFHSLGPFLTDSRLSHGEKCDIVAALEKALADAMHAAGYAMLNKVKCRMLLDETLWRDVARAFQDSFPALMNPKNQ